MNLKRHIAISSPFTWILLILSLAYLGQAQSPNAQADKIKGLSWVGRDSIIIQHYDNALDLGANWISLTAYGWMKAYDDPEIQLDNGSYWWGEREEGILHTAQLAHIKGLHTMLKPHIRMPRGSGYWREDINMRSASDWDKWFDSYEEWILHYAQLSEEYQISALCIGTELYKATKYHPDRWVSLIKKVRQIYNGQVIYAANWYKEYEQITFWSELDYIGIQGYFPLTRRNGKTKKTFLSTWKKYRRNLKKISNRYDKQVFFTEIGYTNSPMAPRRPWVWPQDDDADVDVSDDIQRWCYEAFFETIWDEPWFKGAMIWEWHHPTYKDPTIDKYFTNRAKRIKLWASQTGRVLNPSLLFSPQLGSALGTLKYWFGKQP